ncbi:hypothetical protein [Clostridium hydrogenum]|uniref:hypothetical protein n=1 Tax=Clostridium hydrogenum TaxID=2855764 RepID=UPI001F2DE772
MKKINKSMKIGLCIIAMVLLLKNLSVPLPDFIQGLGLGIGIGLELLGIYHLNHDTSKIKAFKRNLIKKRFNK